MVPGADEADDESTDDFLGKAPLDKKKKRLMTDLKTETDILKNKFDAESDIRKNFENLMGYEE